MRQVRSISRKDWSRIEIPESLRDHMPGTHATRECEEMVRSAWRHAEPGRNALAPDHKGRW